MPDALQGHGLRLLRRLGLHRPDLGRLSAPYGVSQHPVGQITTIGEQNLGIVDLGTDVSNELRLLIDKNILTRGEPFQSGGMLGSACLPLLGVGSAVSSSLFAGNIFLATANPATLMHIGAGVGAAVMGRLQHWQALTAGRRSAKRRCVRTSV